MGFRQILRNVYDSTVSALRVVVEDISIGTSEGNDPGNADVTTTSSAIVAANANRKQLIVTNNSDAIIYLATGKDAVLNTGIRLNPAGGVFCISDGGELYSKEAVYAIHGASGSKQLTYQEFE